MSGGGEGGGPGEEDGVDGGREANRERVLAVVAVFCPMRSLVGWVVGLYELESGGNGLQTG